ncbi:MAG: glutamate--cysteine ligase [Deltaproteobacteria bacterium]|jgi:glutamate--cysteine ligase|nr:glutamate--cysteine ligase [Deltaproteobacteria bacterium]
MNNRKVELHAAIVKSLGPLRDWFGAQRGAVDIPFYSSYDIRDSGFKVANVDANIYPAGFNNICPTDRESAPPLVRYYIDRHYHSAVGGSPVKKLMLITEEHTNNPYYWDNVFTLREILVGAGLQVCVAIPRLATERAVMTTASGRLVEVVSVTVSNGRIQCSCFEPDLVVSNNDFSEFYAEWGETLDLKLNPPRELGWWQRKKSNYFKHYNDLSTEFARIIDVDPWLLTVETELFSGFDMSDVASRTDLAQKVQLQLDRTKKMYAERGINQDPVAFVKNNAGTYGLAVMRVASGEEVMQLNNRARTKMKAAKGGRQVEEVIIQEGVPSIVQAEGVTAEPTLYLFGCQLAGGFLRTHSEKGPTESLNSPGAVYKRLCVSDLKISVEGHPLENVYGWVSRLGVLAIGREAKEMGVRYNGYDRLGSGSECSIVE